MERLTEGGRNYEPPAVIYEAQLEARAGSPLGIPGPLGELGEAE